MKDWWSYTYAAQFSSRRAATSSLVRRHALCDINCLRPPCLTDLLRQLTITYGSKSAHGFLRVYGFIPEGLNVTTIPVRYQIDRFDANRRLKEALFLEQCVPPVIIARAELVMSSVQLLCVPSLTVSRFTSSESIVAGPGHVAQALNVLRVLLNDDTRVRNRRVCIHSPCAHCRYSLTRALWSAA